MHDVSAHFIGTGNSQLTLFILEPEVQGLRAGVSNVRPAGRMRPTNGFNAAREIIGV